MAKAVEAVLTTGHPLGERLVPARPNAGILQRAIGVDVKLAMVARQHARVRLRRVAAARNETAPANDHQFVRARRMGYDIPDTDDLPAVLRVVLALLDQLPVIAAVDPDAALELSAAVARRALADLLPPFHGRHVDVVRLTQAALNWKTLRPCSSLLRKNGLWRGVARSHDLPDNDSFAIPLTATHAACAFARAFVDEVERQVMATRAFSLTGRSPEKTYSGGPPGYSMIEVAVWGSSGSQLIVKLTPKENRVEAESS